MWSADGQTLYYVTEYLRDQQHRSPAAQARFASRRRHEYSDQAGAVTQHTEESVRRARISGNGEWIVYECGPDLWVVGTARAASRASSPSRSTPTTRPTRSASSPSRAAPPSSPDRRREAPSLFAVHGKLFRMPVGPKPKPVQLTFGAVQRSRGRLGARRLEDHLRLRPQRPRRPLSARSQRSRPPEADRGAAIQGHAVDQHARGRVRRDVLARRQARRLPPRRQAVDDEPRRQGREGRSSATFRCSITTGRPTASGSSSPAGTARSPANCTSCPPPGRRRPTRSATSPATPPTTPASPGAPAARSSPSSATAGASANLARPRPGEANRGRDDRGQDQTAGLRRLLVERQVVVDHRLGRPALAGEADRARPGVRRRPFRPTAAKVAFRDLVGRDLWVASTSGGQVTRLTTGRPVPPADSAGRNARAAGRHARRHLLPRRQRQHPSRQRLPAARRRQRRPTARPRCRSRSR